MNSLDIEHRGKTESQINGAICNAIDAHGPITRENSSSAAKRVYECLKGIARAQRRAGRLQPGEKRQEANKGK